MKTFKRALCYENKKTEILSNNLPKLKNNVLKAINAS